MADNGESDEDFICETQTQMSVNNVPTPTSRLEYWWFILFQWEINLEQPFQIIVKHVFKDRGIPASWYNGCLSDNCRRLKLCLPDLPGERYSVFAKVEKGIFIFLYMLSEGNKIR